jgi:hypothetical protein
VIGRDGKLSAANAGLEIAAPVATSMASSFFMRRSSLLTQILILARRFALPRALSATKDSRF